MREGDQVLWDHVKARLRVLAQTLGQLQPDAYPRGDAGVQSTIVPPRSPMRVPQDKGSDGRQAAHPASARSATTKRAIAAITRARRPLQWDAGDGPPVPSR